MATKLARTYSAQLDAIKSYRTGGEQRVTVQHVSVSEGSQTIVGNVTQNVLKEPAATRAVADSRQAAMPCLPKIFEMRTPYGISHSLTQSNSRQPGHLNRLFGRFWNFWKLCRLSKVGSISRKIRR